MIRAVQSVISNTLASEMLSDMIDLSGENGSPSRARDLELTARSPAGDDEASERSRKIALANDRIADFRRAGQVSLIQIPIVLKMQHRGLTRALGHKGVVSGAPTACAAA